jgi:hypothetical protein
MSEVNLELINVRREDVPWNEISYEIVWEIYSLRSNYWRKLDVDMLSSDRARKFVKAGQNLNFKQKFQFSKKKFNFKQKKSQFCQKLSPKNLNFAQK